MPASPIMKKVTLPNNWVQLQKMFTPDQATACYWSVWFDAYEYDWNSSGEGKAWLMWCPFGDDPSINDNWGHAEEINGDCKNVLDTILAVYDISFHEFIYHGMSKGQILKDAQ